MDLGLKNKRVFITASSGGIGLWTAKLFLHEGATVIINGRNQNKLNDIKKQLQMESNAERVDTFAGDMSNKEIIASSKNYVNEKWGALDILIANCGTGKALSKNQLDIVEWEYMMKQNLFSTVNLIREFEPLLQNGWSSNIVIISSIIAYERANAPYAYAAAKSSILTLNSYLAGDYAKRGIRVNCVAPGNVFYAGGRWEELMKEDIAGVEEYIKKNVPMGRFATPEEVASAIVFLASEKSSFTTGAVIAVDGGQKRSI